MSAIHIPNCEERFVAAFKQCAKDRERSAASLARFILKDWVSKNPPNPQPRKRKK